MRRVASLLCLWAAAAGAPPATYRVAGVVVDAITGSPLAGANVTLSPIRQPEREIAIATAADGRFAFEGIAAGKHSLALRARGYPLQNYGQAGESFGVAVVTGPQEDTSGIVFRASPGAAISGRVLDEAGEPVYFATVHLFHSTIAGGRKRVYYGTPAWSDDTGAFRFSKLRAGTYYLAVSAKPWYARRAAGETGELHRTCYPLVWYPNATTPAGAAPLSLKAGQEITADLSMTALTCASLRVSAPNDGKTTVLLLADGFPGAEPIYDRADSPNAPGPLFRVAPGRYLVRVGQNPNREVEVGVTDTTVTIAPPLSPLTGVLKIEGEAPAAQIMVLLRAEGNNSSYPSQVKPDGTFAIPNVPPGKYTLQLPGADGCYLKSASAEGARVSGRSLEVTGPGPVRLSLAAASDGGRVDGKIYSGGRVLPGALAVLAPRERSADPAGYRGFQTDSDGSFDFTNLPPGDYILVAVENSEGLEYADPEVFAALALRQGRALRVEAHSTQQVRIDLGSPPEP